jgi:GNAT superfamily N-acetyltransferase
MDKEMSDFELATGYIPGVIGRIAELHADYYSKNWGFGSYFESKVATELSNFIQSYNQEKDCIYTVLSQGKIEGSISIDGSSESNNIAHLRWFILSDNLRGNGAGNQLMQHALRFCNEKAYDGIYLWTFKGLESAKHLYEKFGFVLSEEFIGDQWGSVVTEQRYDVRMSDIKIA